jgi:hypothetical protein
MLLPIQGWDYTPTSCSSEFVPVFYFVPDYEWVSYLNINGHRNVPINITGTNKYDGKYWVKVDKQPETLWYVGFLPFVFTGYPEGVGNVELDIRHQEIPPFLKCAINGCC